jgi:SAM-dependent methyltransferase
MSSTTPTSPRRKRKFSRRLKSSIRSLIRIEDLANRVTDLETSIGQVSAGQVTSLLQMKGLLPPIPPRHLQVRVAGAHYGEFFQHGTEMLGDFDRILKSEGSKVLDFKNILDFGCGCGRFLIPISLRGDAARFSGTDIDPEAIEWLKQNYSGFRDLDVNSAAPPTKYADGTFDFVFSVSIFTHLPEDMQHGWLKELSRIIQPGGYGIFTTHGPGHFHHLKKNKDARVRLPRDGFYYDVRGQTDGLPDFYQTSFHTHEYIRREWSKYFEVISIHEKGIARDQDGVLVRKR